MTLKSPADLHLIVVPLTSTRSCTNCGVLVQYNPSVQHAAEIHSRSSAPSISPSTPVVSEKPRFCTNCGTKAEIATAKFDSSFTFHSHSLQVLCWLRINSGWTPFCRFCSLSTDPRPCPRPCSLLDRHRLICFW